LPISTRSRRRTKAITTNVAHPAHSLDGKTQISHAHDVSSGDPSLVDPERVWSRAEVLARPSPAPKAPGVYAWFFKEIPPFVDPAGCIEHEDLTLLYVGIAPKEPPRNGKPPSKQTLHSRLRYHYRGNAYGSTLRLTLGCLLSEVLGIELRRVGSGTRMTFTRTGELALSEWMGENAFVAWIEHPQPWLLEDALIGELDVPLNLDGNKHNAFYASLKSIRAAARARAATLPVTT
jgi:hypothetical protein